MGTGRRKTSIARVRLKAGSGKRTVNGRDLDQYFSRLALSRIAIQPLVSSNNLDKYDIVANVRGGGTTGQAGGISPGGAGPLVRLNPTLRGMPRQERLPPRRARVGGREKDADG